MLPDTVGFVPMPSSTVVADYGASLEELTESDLLLHVIGITQRKAPEQAEGVAATLFRCQPIRRCHWRRW